MTTHNTPAGIAALAEALATFAVVIPEIREGAAHLTCREAEAIAGVLAAIGSEEDAAEFISGHALGDDEESDDHHEAYLEAHE